MTQAPMGRRLRSFVQRKVPLMMTCREFETFVLDYLDGTLPTMRRFVFELHIVFCRECRDYLTAFRRTIEAGKAAFLHPDAALPDDVPDDLVRAVLAARRPDLKEDPENDEDER